MWFPHVHVASAYSAHYGVAAPGELAGVAAAQGAQILACTDRDGLYGAVKHVLACRAHGLVPVLGVDLAVLGSRTRRQTRDRATARGGGRAASAVPEVVGRVVVLATGSNAGRGYAALCRLVSAAHRGHDRNPRRPIGVSPAELARHVHRAAAGGSPGLVVLAGPDSPPGRLLARRHYRPARSMLNAWHHLLPRESLLLEAVTHLAPQGSPLSTGHAVRILEAGRDLGIPVVLSNAVRYARPEQAATADVLDAARTLLSLDELAGAERGVLQPTGQGWLKDGPEMFGLAREISAAAGTGSAGAVELLEQTRRVAERCVQDPVGDLKLGRAVIPEASVLGLREDPDEQLAARCRAGLSRRYPQRDWRRIMPGLSRESLEQRLERELDVISHLGFAGYFLTVSEVSELMSALGVRHAARGSAVSSLVVHLLGISPVDPLEYDLVFERFLSPRRTSLPDIDIDTESAQRHRIYREIFHRFGAQRVSLMSMQNAYRSRGAVRDAGLALGLPQHTVDHVATALWRVPGASLREEIGRRPELHELAQQLRESRQLDLLVDLTERLDRLPRHISVHPCGVILSDTTLLDRTPVQASGMGLPMSQFDKHDMDPMGLIKLDILGVRIQSSIAHAVSEITRLEPEEPAPALDTMARDDPDTYRLIRSTHTLGCFQIESPGQRELIGTMGPREFNDLIVDISLFRPGPMQASMVRPYLNARHGWDTAHYPHPDLVEILEETHGVAVYHEQIMRIMDRMTGCGLATADEWRRRLGSATEPRVERTFRDAAAARGYGPETVDEVWQILHAFGSFGFCKAHAVAFALPTYQTAWLKTHHPEAYLAGVWEHDPGMYPARLLVGEARRMGIPVLGPDVNHSGSQHRVEPLAPHTAAPAPSGVRSGDLDRGIAHTRSGRWGVRMALGVINGLSTAEIERITAAAPFDSLADLRARARPSRRSVHRLAAAGALDGVLGSSGAAASHTDLVAHLGALADAPAAPRGAPEITPGQLALPLGDIELHSLSPHLPEPDLQQRVREEVETMDLEVSGHLMGTHGPALRAYGVTPADQLLRLRNGTEVVVAGVRVSTMTPPMRSGRRVVFISVDDGSGTVDCTFFDEAQHLSGPVLFAPSLLLIHGHTRRTGPRGIGVQAVRAWDLGRPETLPEPGTVLGSCPRPSRGPSTRVSVPAPPSPPGG